MDYVRNYRLYLSMIALMRGECKGLGEWDAEKMEGRITSEHGFVVL